LLLPFCLAVSLCTLVLPGCGEESSPVPVDGRDFDGVGYSAGQPYTGKVIDGYLQDARVWLDMDGDGQYSPGPLVLELANGADVVLESGEPTTLSGAGGAFSLDTSELAVAGGVGPDLNPADYPLYALAIPGKTREQGRDGEVLVDQAFLMSAPPGIRNITPLTTLARYRVLAGAEVGADSPGAGLNLLRDYVLAGDDRAHTYARALARFMASQIPEAYTSLLSAPDSDGRERYLSPQGVFLLGVSLVQNAGEIMARVDAAAAGDYAGVNVDGLVLPEVLLELGDPVLLTRQRVYGYSESAGQLPARRSALGISAEVFFDYSEDGRLLAVSANGCLAPSMPELLRLILVRGYPAQLQTQWLPAVALSPQSRIHYDQPGIDERLVFDWEDQSIRFETTTTCHDHEAILAGSTELGGNPEIIYSWTREQGEVTQLRADISRPDGSLLTRILVPETSAEDRGFPGYRITEDDTERATLTFAGGFVSCAPDPQVTEAQQIVTATRAYSFASEGQPLAAAGGLALEFDTRSFRYPGPEDLLPVSRLLRYGFSDTAMSALDNVDAENGFEWALYYPEVGAKGFVAEQPDLITEAYLKSYSGSRPCGRQFEQMPTGAYARVEYIYQSLSAYLVGLLQ